jgi:hypothetical protein
MFERKFQPRDSAALTQRTAASPSMAGRIDRRHAFRKFKESTLDDKT